MNRDKVEKALQNEENEIVLDLTTKKIKEMKNNILQQIGLHGETLRQIHRKLKDYRFCGEIKDLRYGYYIRFINLNKIIEKPDEIKLQNGGLLMDVILDNHKVYLKIRSVYQTRKRKKFGFYNLVFDEVLVFQKLSEQEQILVSINDYLEKK